MRVVNSRLMRSNQKGFAHVTLVLIFVILGVGGLSYLAYKNGQIISRYEKYIVPSPTPSINEEISNWKIYTDSEYGYSIRYPGDWGIEKACMGGHANDTYVCLKSQDLETSAVPSVIQGQLVTIAPKGSSYFAGENSPPSDYCKENTIDKVRSCSEISIDNTKAIKKVFDNYPFVDVVIIENNTISFIVRLQYSDELEKGQEFAVFDQILSTFRFLN